VAIDSPARRALLFPYQLFVLFCFFSLTCLYGAMSYFASFVGSNGNLAHHCLTQWARVSLFAAGFQVRVTGLERLSQNATYIFMPNHASFLDILLLLAYLPHNFRFIIKKEILSVPLLGSALRRSGNIPMDRKNPWRALRSLRRSADLLKDGISIVVFPEGTRSANGEIQDLKTALFILPIRSRTPVVPVLIEGTFDALKRGSILLHPRPLKMTFYDPIPAHSFGVRDRTSYAEKVRQALGGETLEIPSRSFG
jgi:1-acyl-sn-glycerol-3-phosphate acyltransferase